MKSPFPGMDPYIEMCGLWEDFHGHLIEKIGDSLADSVPDNYIVRGAERNNVVLAEEAFIEDDYRETFVEIREAAGQGRLVTAIEVLSPVNKKPSSAGWDLVKRKRQGLFMERSASLVEIDLLRGGQRMPMVDPWPNCPYTLLVARSRNLPMCKVWPAHFRQPLPIIPIPLAGSDPDVKLDLQPMIDAIYSRYRYRRTINYGRPLVPPLTAEEADWVKEHLQG